MNQQIIKNLIRLGLRNHYSKTGYPGKIDIINNPFYMSGRHILFEEEFKKIIMLPKIIFFPADPDAVIEDYWAVAVCMGPVEGGVTTLTFSFRPWGLRLPEFTNDADSMYTLILILKDTIPPELFRGIHYYLKRAPPKNTILKAVY